MEAAIEAAAAVGGAGVGLACVGTDSSELSNSGIESSLSVRGGGDVSPRDNGCELVAVALAAAPLPLVAAPLPLVAAVVEEVVLLGVDEVRL